MAAPSAEELDGRLQVLAEAVDLAVAAARRDARSNDAPPPPRSLRPVLGFARLPPRARRSVLDALDADEGFRARVAEKVDEADVERATWLFLRRPDGWSEELGAMADAAAQSDADARAERDEQSAQRQLERMSEAESRLRGELDSAIAAAEGAREELSAERDRRRRGELELAREHAKVEALEADLAKAVGDLTASRRLAEERLAQLRELESALRAASAGSEPDATAGSATSASPEPPRGEPPVPSPWGPADASELAAAVVAASAAAAQLGEALAVAASSLGVDTSAEAAKEPRDAAAPSQVSARTRPPRRTPLRLRRGVVEEDPDAVAQLFAHDGVVVFVDGYNVSMTGWPSLGRAEQRDALVSALSSDAARSEVSVHVVFDGDDDGRRPAVSTNRPVRVHFSAAGVEADDVILDMVGRSPTDRPVVVVSSDRRVRDGARRLGANVVASGQLLEHLRR